MRHLACSEIWGGFSDRDTEVCSSALTASLYSASCDGGRGGDIYYLSVCGKDMLTRIVVADVMGHGRQVSDTSEMLYDALARHMNSLDGDALLGDLNARALEIGFEAITTAAVLSVFTDDQRLRFSYAGHHPAAVLRRRDPVWRPLPLDEATARGTNIPLAVDADAAYDQQQLDLDSGDRLFLYTDGVVEAPRAGGDASDQFGHRRLLETLNAAAPDAPLGDLKRDVLDAVRSFTGGTLTHDDVTVVAIEAR